MMILYGGNGFIGKHTNKLTEGKGIEASVVTPSVDYDFVAKHALNTKFYSLEDYQDHSFNKVISKATSFVYLASRSIPSTNINTPWSEFEANASPALQVFQRVFEANPNTRVVLLSSGGTVYGRNDGAPIKEDKALQPISAYGLGKVIIEQSLEYIGRVKGQKYTILRVSNPVGVWHKNPKQGLVMAVLRALQLKEPITIYGDGSTIRDYIDADDLADAIVQVALDENSTSNIFNVGSGKGVSIIEVVRTISKVLNKEALLEYKPARDFDIKRIVLCSDKINSYCGWKAKHDLKAIIEKITLALR